MRSSGVWFHVEKTNGRARSAHSIVCAYLPTATPRCSGFAQRPHRTATNSSISDVRVMLDMRWISRQSPHHRINERCWTPSPLSLKDVGETNHRHLKTGSASQTRHSERHLYIPTIILVGIPRVLVYFGSNCELSMLAIVFGWIRGS
jgi:hypothetical protein